MSKNDDKKMLIDYATGAKQFMANADVDPVPDEYLLRAAVVFHMLERDGKLGPAATMEPPPRARLSSDPLAGAVDIDGTSAATARATALAMEAFERSHTIALIASGFADVVPSTPHRADLFAVVLEDA
jgi:hypothetical protein